MGNLRIGIRLSILIAIMLLAVMIIGFTSYVGLTQANRAFTEVEESVQKQRASSNLTHVIAIKFANLVHDAHLGVISLDTGHTKSGGH
ncbi:MAG: MCP four helix bundle domain-containing protein [Candidatus Competibacteraceae bacterium]|nr:MCP four helix bundle domain-containing protein [Candidatus Competibacteraceae bacterium]